MREYANYTLDLLNYQLFAIGGSSITPLGIISLVILSIILIYVSQKLKYLLIARILTRTSMSLGARQAIGTITRYFILFIGFIIILQTVGINLTTLNVLAGAIGIGIGLGLQNIANNFISGLIVLLERPIQAGDRIDIKGVTGEVVSIGARATRVRTNDNIAIIVPNSKLISDNLVNWSYERGAVRFKIPVMVEHSADVRLVERLMLEAAVQHPEVEKEPAPVVRLMNWDEEGMYFELRAWSKLQLRKPAVLRSDLNFAIAEKLRANKIRMSRNQSSYDEYQDVANGANGVAAGSSRRKTAARELAKARSNSASSEDSDDE